MRVIQLLLAVGGMVLAMRYGAERVPPWGDATGVPPHWVLHMLPMSIGLIMIGLAMALIWAKDKA
jgi:hypothetical protein